MSGYEFDDNLYNVAIGSKYPDRLYTIESHAFYQNYYAVKEAKENPHYSPLKFHKQNILNFIL